MFPFSEKIQDVIISLAMFFKGSSIIKLTSLTNIGGIRPGPGDLFISKFSSIFCCMSSISAKGILKLCI